MAVFSNQVKEGLINYFNALLSYPISKERAKEKFTNLVNALNGLDNGIVKIRCKWKDLGQKYDKNGRMLIPDLYQYVWKDEADRPWSFSYVLDTNGIAHILIMKYSHFVKENNQNKTYKEMSRIRLTESQLHNVIRRCVNEALRETENKQGLKEFMKYYDDDDSCEEALRYLHDSTFLAQNGWFEVFHEGHGNGICSPKEGIVAVFDEDDLPLYHSYQFYKYNPKAWIRTSNGGWDDIYNGNNGGQYDVEPY